jgi:hypothetical protein
MVRCLHDMVGGRLRVCAALPRRAPAAAAAVVAALERAGDNTRPNKPAAHRARRMLAGDVALRGHKSASAFHARHTPKRQRRQAGRV